MKCMRLKNLLIPILLFTEPHLIVSVSSAEEIPRDDWSITLGLGVFYGAEYEGSDESETMVAPNIEVVWRDRIFLNLEGIGINYYRNDSIVLNAAVSQGDDREESLNASLNGLGDIDTSTTITLGAEIELGLFISNVDLIRHIGGTDGTQVIVGLETVLPLRILTGNFDVANMELEGETEDLLIIGPLVTAGLTADWGDNDYTSGFFSVNAEQSLRSGLPQYTAEAGFRSLNFELGVLYPVSKSWIAQGLVGYSKLIGDAEGSPIVKANDDIIFGGFISYQF